MSDISDNLKITTGILFSRYLQDHWVERHKDQITKKFGRILVNNNFFFDFVIYRLVPDSGPISVSNLRGESRKNHL